MNWQTEKKNIKNVSWGNFICLLMMMWCDWSYGYVLLPKKIKIYMIFKLESNAYHYRKDMHWLIYDNRPNNTVVFFLNLFDFLSSVRYLYWDSIKFEFSAFSMFSFLLSFIFFLLFDFSTDVRAYLGLTKSEFGHCRTYF